MYSQVRTLMIIQAIHSPQIIQTYAVTLRARDQELAVCLLALAAVNMATPKHNPQKILAMFMCRLVTTSSLYQGGTRNPAMMGISMAVNQMRGSLGKQKLNESPLV